MNTKTLEAKAQMMIRKPVAEVFAAFIDPQITKTSGLQKAVASSKQARKFAGDGKCMGLRRRLM